MLPARGVSGTIYDLPLVIVRHSTVLGKEMTSNDANIVELTRAYGVNTHDRGQGNLLASLATALDGLDSKLKHDALHIVLFQPDRVCGHISRSLLTTENT